MLIGFSKIIYILFIFYIGWFQNIFFIIPRIPLILGFGMIVLLLLYKISISKEVPITITKPIFIWILFSIYIFVSGLFVADNKIHLIRSLLTYVQTLAMMIYIINVSVIEKDNKFFLKSYLFYSIVYMFTMLFWGFDAPGGRLYLSTSSNPNGDGLTLLLGVFCILALFKSKKIIKLILTFGFVGLFTYTIILTGSRKSFIAVILLILLWVIFVFKDYWNDYTIIKKISAATIFLVILIILVPEITSIFLESNLYLRLIETGVSTSGDRIRIGMYQEAIRFFKESPLFGIGFKQYENLSIYRTYSHSTYAEILSTTGIIGTLIYFSSYVVIIYNLFKVYIKKRGSTSSTKALQYLVMMFIMLILGTGIIHFYGIIYSIMFAIMISFYYIENKKIRKDDDYVKTKNIY